MVGRRAEGKRKEVVWQSVLRLDHLFGKDVDDLTLLKVIGDEAGEDRSRRRAKEEDGTVQEKRRRDGSWKATGSGSRGAPHDERR